MPAAAGQGAAGAAVRGRAGHVPELAAGRARAPRGHGRAGRGRAHVQAALRHARAAREERRAGGRAAAAGAPRAARAPGRRRGAPTPKIGSGLAPSPKTPAAARCAAGARLAPQLVRSQWSLLAPQTQPLRSWACRSASQCAAAGSQRSQHPPRHFCRGCCSRMTHQRRWWQKRKRNALGGAACTQAVLEEPYSTQLKR